MNATVRAVALFAKSALEQIARLEKDPSLLLPDPSDPTQAKSLVSSWADTHGHPYRDAAIVALKAPDGSNVVVERYLFSLNPTEFEQAEITAKGSTRLSRRELDGIRWGRSCTWKGSKRPQVPFRALEVTINAPSPGICYVEIVQSHRQNAQLGGVADASTFAHGKALSLPWLHPKREMCVHGYWTQQVPSAFQAETPFVLAIDFTGLAQIVVTHEALPANSLLPAISAGCPAIRRARRVSRRAREGG